jgi:hypothetical protein
MPRVRATIQLRGESTVELDVPTDDPSESDILDAAYAQTVLPSMDADYGDVSYWEVIGDGS